MVSIYNSTKINLTHISIPRTEGLGIDFKLDTFFILDPKELVKGKINPTACRGIFTEAERNNFDVEIKLKKNSLVNVIICVKGVRHCEHKSTNN